MVYYLKKLVLPALLLVCNVLSAQNLSPISKGKIQWNSIGTLFKIKGGEQNVFYALNNNGKNYTLWKLSISGSEPGNELQTDTKANFSADNVSFFPGKKDIYSLEFKFTKKNYKVTLNTIDGQSLSTISSTEIANLPSEDKDKAIYKSYSPDSSYILYYIITSGDRNGVNHYTLVFNNEGKLIKQNKVKVFHTLHYFNFEDATIDNKGQVALLYCSRNTEKVTKETHYIYDLNVIDADDELYTVQYPLEENMSISDNANLRFLKNGDLLISYGESFNDFNGNVEYDPDRNISWDDKNLYLIRADRFSMKTHKSVWATENAKCFRLDTALWNNEEKKVSDYYNFRIISTKEMENGDICFNGDVAGGSYGGGLYHMFISGKGKLKNTTFTTRYIANELNTSALNTLTYAYGNDIYELYQYPLYKLLNKKKPSVLDPYNEMAYMIHRTSADGDSIGANLTGEKSPEYVLYKYMPLKENELLIYTKSPAHGKFEKLTLPMKPVYKEPVKAEKEAENKDKTTKSATPKPVSNNPRGRKIKR